MGAEHKTKTDDKRVKAGKKQIKHDPQAESARTVFGKGRPS